MANGFTAELSGKPYYNSEKKVWLYRVIVRHELGNFDFTVGVAEKVPEDHRDDEAKKMFQGFAAALSNEVHSWTSIP